ncbi:uncharacterized protein LOC130935552 isoform X2 [Arachis stenosperma]|uniref:uncharacterized protein LOC130935552 isoform X2 n=1 Tax=Arachis stenosperma TaxID=217475 RepID=UPI0025AD10E8|nr:uncharacterized protein LOC130935552 isoform X2 [Arachis stenosperma]
MWRQNILRHNHDSDQSISDDDVDEPDDACPNDVVSIKTLKASAAASSKEELPLPVRLDFLKGISNQNLAGTSSSLSIKEPTDTPPEDEVEMPEFNEGDSSSILGEVAANSSDEEVIQDEGNTVLSIRELRKYGPQFIRHKQVRVSNERSEALLPSKESSSCSALHASTSRANRSGVWSKAKSRISMSSLSHKCGNLGPSMSDRLPEKKADGPWASATLDSNHTEDNDGVELSSDTEPAETEAIAPGPNLPSMADLFENLQDKTHLAFPVSTFQYFPHGQTRGKIGHTVQKRSRSDLPDMIADSEDSPDLVDSGSSSDNEESNQHMRITFYGKKTQTMADRFQEALGTSSVIAEGTHVGVHNSSRAGIFGKLQQVMQTEKERDLDFWKKLQSGARPDSELGCFDVKIISRYLDGKLTVCHCSFGKFTEHFPSTNNRESTIIFSPRVCDNVDLEVGNLIRIHPPWKEIQVGNDRMILCTYFSQI